MISNSHRVAVVAGSAGVVARFGSDLIAIGGSSSAIAAAMTELTAAEVRGDEFVETLQAVTGVDVAAIVTTAAGFDAVVVGNGVVATPDGNPADSDSAIVWVGIGPAPTDADSRPSTLSFLHLHGGCVPGQGALVAAPVNASLDHDPVDNSADDSPVEDDAAAGVSVDRTDPSAEIIEPIADAPATPPDRAPGGPTTEVMGIQCSREHFNNPRAAYCQVCGISMVHTTHYLVPGPRPTLGFLVFDDGVTFALDRSYCIGREPVIDPGRDLSPLVLPDGRHSVSRSHAELVLDEWNLVLHDLGSTNGTFVWDAKNQRWDQVMQGQPVTVEPGQWVAVGRKVFTYESVASPA